MNDNGLSSLVAAILGFALGGIVGDVVEDAAGIMIAVATASGIGGGAIAAYRGAEIARTSALTAGGGLLVGAAVAALDQVIGR